jgi:hypothetical protein
MSLNPRFKCPVCNRDLALTKSGEFRHHFRSKTSREVCPASALTIGEAIRVADLERIAISVPSVPSC